VRHKGWKAPTKIWRHIGSAALLLWSHINTEQLSSLISRRPGHKQGKSLGLASYNVPPCHGILAAAQEIGCGIGVCCGSEVGPPIFDM
jgi:hypothetical protein